VLRIEADVLIPGRGDTIRNGCVVVDGGVIEFAGSVEDAPKASRRGQTLSVPVVMPGMWDVHGHFMGLRTANVEEITRTPPLVLGIRTAADAARAIDAGFTSVREPGGLGLSLARVIDEGTLPGPQIYAAGSSLSQTGGHGDLHSYPLELVEVLTRAGVHAVVCDGVPECLRAVRLQLRRGAKLIKVLASGGVMSELDDPIHQQFSDEELRAIVEEAARADRIVAAHCHGKAGIVAALKAGCRTIEHGSFLDEEAAEMMLAKDAILVPTRFILERLLKFAKEANVPDYAYRKLVGVHASHTRALALAIRKGVRIGVGTDIFSSGPGTGIAWGMNGEELVHLVAAGMKPLRAIEAATATGPMTLGAQAPKSGLLKAGYDADLIALEKNPLQDISVLANPERITKVWKSGALVKGEER